MEKDNIHNSEIEIPSKSSEHSSRTGLRALVVFFYAVLLVFSLSIGWHVGRVDNISQEEMITGIFFLMIFPIYILLDSIISRIFLVCALRGFSLPIVFTFMYWLGRNFARHRHRRDDDSLLVGLIVGLIYIAVATLVVGITRLILRSKHVN
jgi:hypothetical protein